MNQIELNYTRWMNSKKLPAEVKKQIRLMNQKDVDDAFFTDLTFGTAGMRGILGWGTNRLNIFTLRKACVGFAKYVLKCVDNAKIRGVVIARDNRHMGLEFQEECVKVLNAYGIKVFVFPSLRPTPELSFAVRYFGAAGGIMLTASHNPKEYNGFKVYDEYGCQLVPVKVNKLIDIISDLPSELEVTLPKIKGNVREEIGSRIDTDYLELVKLIQLKPELNKENFRIVFTPQHGTSYVNAMRLFEELGYDVYPVLSQIDPDPNFSGTLSPNPEDPRSFIEAIKLAKEVKAHLIVMTDPDGDRVGLAYRNIKDEYILVNGNVSAAILLDYVLRTKKDRGSLHQNSVVYNTIVSSEIGQKICEYYGVKHNAFLTGFKYIGEEIQRQLECGGPTFVFGYEESYGCLLAPFVRDKDGIQAILMYCEMALNYHLSGLYLDDAYHIIQEKVGFYSDSSYSIEFKGPKGAVEMDSIMKRLQQNPLKQVGIRMVRTYEDYGNSIGYDFVNNTTYPLLLEKSDVIRIRFTDDCYLAIRPSGTEPKCKFYIGICAKKQNDVLSKDIELFDELKKSLDII